MSANDGVICPGNGHLTLWCGTCNAEDHRDTRFYEPTTSGPVSRWMTQPDTLRVEHDGQGHGHGHGHGADLRLELRRC